MHVQKKMGSSIALLLLSLTVLLAACGQAGNGAGQAAGTAESAGAASSGASAEGTEASADSGTKRYQAANGDIEVPVNPQRIVDTTTFFTGYFLALGAKPVGVTDQAMSNPYLAEMLDGVENLGSDISAEKILSLNPDLIVVFSGIEGIEQLAEIAPVVAIEYGKKTYKEQLVEFGRLTGKEEEAEAWVEQWETKINELKPQVQAAVGDKTVSILNPYAKGLYVFGHNYGRGGEIIYGEFGLQAPPAAQKEAIDSGTGWASISLELLPEFAGDIIFTCPWSGDTSDPSVVYDNPIWQGLPAVQAEHVFQLNPQADTYNDPISLEAQLAFITDSLLSVAS